MKCEERQIEQEKGMKDRDLKEILRKELRDRTSRIEQKVKKLLEVYDINKSGERLRHKKNNTDNNKIEKYQSRKNNKIT